MYGSLGLRLRRGFGVVEGERLLGDGGGVYLREGIVLEGADVLAPAE